MDKNKKELNPQDIRQLLDHSLAQIERPALTRLHHAREQALAHHATRYTEPVFARAGHAIWHASRTRSHSRQLAAAFLLLCILICASLYWNYDAKPDTSDIDIAILTDDIPIHYFVD